jgi:hypothetical protein
MEMNLHVAIGDTRGRAEQAIEPKVLPTTDIKPASADASAHSCHKMLCTLLVIAVHGIR